MIISWLWYAETKSNKRHLCSFGCMYECVLVYVVSFKAIINAFSNTKAMHKPYQLYFRWFCFFIRLYIYISEYSLIYTLSLIHSWFTQTNAIRQIDAFSCMFPSFDIRETRKLTETKTCVSKQKKNKKINITQRVEKTKYIENRPYTTNTSEKRRKEANKYYNIRCIWNLSTVKRLHKRSYTLFLLKFSWLFDFVHITHLNAA